MKSGRFMIALVLGLLFSGVGANVYLVYAAARDPSFAVEPAYYEKAVRWDEIQAERQSSAKLGWSVEARLGAEALRVELRDEQGLPVVDAEVELEVFHNARAKERLLSPATPSESGYELPGPFDRPGLWVVRVRARRGPALFVAELEVERS